MKEGGNITTQKTIWCGEETCSVWDQLSYQKGLAQVWRRLGWRRTRDRGWICPDCAKKREKSKT